MHVIRTQGQCFQLCVLIIPHRLRLALLLFDAQEDFSVSPSEWRGISCLMAFLHPTKRWKLAQIVFLFSFASDTQKRFSNSSTFDHISLFYQSNFDALIINTSAKFLDKFTNNKQKTKLSQSQSENGNCFLQEKILLIKYKNQT